jgi:inhibitor of cysteine peptidase
VSAGSAPPLCDGFGTAHRRDQLPLQCLSRNNQASLTFCACAVDGQRISTGHERRSCGGNAAYRTTKEMKMGVHQEALPRMQRPPRPLFWATVAIGLIVVAAIAMIIASFASDGSDASPAAVTLTEADQGRAISVNTGDEIAIRLDSNPTTGYEWAVAALDEQRITYLTSNYEAPKNGMVGQGGTQELRFRATGAGESTLALKYWRSWEGDASIVEQFSVTIRVSE